MPAIEIVPHVVHDLAGASVTLSEHSRQEIARLIETGAAYIYVAAGPDRDFWNAWLNEAIDQRTGYHGVRVALCDWERRWEVLA
jgi:hypothetical protein